MAMDRDKASAFSSQKAFAGFEQADFGAYEPKKWSSNAHTLARRTAKDKVLAVAHFVQNELAEELQSLELFGSDEAPTISNGRKVEAQWAFFIRDQSSRSILKPRLQTTDLGAASLFDIALQSQHVSLSIKLNFEGIFVSVDLPSKANVDRENLKLLLQEDTFKLEFIDRLKSLPGGSTMGFETDRVDALSVENAQLEDLSEQLLSHDGLFCIRTAITSEDALAVEDALMETIAEMIARFVPLYKLLAWSEDKDRIEVLKAIKEVEKTKKQAHVATFQVGERVTILSGLFSGRMGYLQEINDSGKAKVMVGPIAVNVEAKDLKAN
jgi:hypothetical protein